VFFCFFQFCEVGGLAYGLNREISKPFFPQVVTLGAVFQKHSFVQSTNPAPPTHLVSLFLLGQIDVSRSKTCYNLAKG
jgi:hypothetical protein